MINVYHLKDLMLGSIIETSTQEGWIRTDLDSKIRKITLDDYHLDLPFHKGDYVFYSSSGKLLVLIPKENDIVVEKIYSHLSGISPVFSKVIIEKVLKYIEREKFSPETKSDKILSTFLNVLAWKDEYTSKKGEALHEIVDKGVPLVECQKLIKYWLKQHLYRQFALWGLSETQAKIVIEEHVISNPTIPIDIDSILLTLSETPGRYLAISQEIPDEKIHHLEEIFTVNGIFKAERTPSSIISIKKQLRSSTGDTYIPFTKKHMFSLRKDVNRLGVFGLIVFDDNTKISLISTYKLERQVASRIQAKISNSSYDWANLSFKFRTPHEGLSQDQLDGIKMIFSSQISIITGGPGTGKTKLIHGVIREALARGIKYHVAAFTGKAVGRVKETAHPEQIEASTLDMMFVRGSKFYQFNLLILEEASMITTKYIYKLFQKFNPLIYQIVLVGDLDQIPPLDKGHFFSSLLWSKRVPYIRLTKNFRVDEVYGGDIVRNAAKIVDPLRDYSVPVELDLESRSFNVIKGGIRFLQTILNKIEAKSLNSMTILTPYNQEVKTINRIFQTIKYSTRDEYISSYNYRWYVGDRIMVIENDVAIDIANGDLGYVSEILDDNIQITLDKNDSIRIFSLKEVEKKLRHSYCFTINKSQGSEYDTVILYLPDHEANNFFLNLNMIYTAITRAKKMVWIIVETPETLFRACNKRIKVPNDILKDSIIAKFPHREYVGTLIERAMDQISCDGDEEYSEYEWDE